MQDVIAILIVAAAIIFLVRRGCQSLANRRASACGACAACAASESGQLITISTEMSHAKVQRRDEVSP
jgi:hypothetical protein